VFLVGFRLLQTPHACAGHWRSILQLSCR
jgi:hypothetical protein